MSMSHEIAVLFNRNGTWKASSTIQLTGHRTDGFLTMALQKEDGIQKEFQWRYILAYSYIYIYRCRERYTDRQTMTNS